jgi:hypothetical protein
LAFRFVTSKIAQAPVSQAYQSKEGILKKPPQGQGFAPAAVSTVVQEKTSAPPVVIPQTESGMVTAQEVLAQEYLYLHKKVLQYHMKETLAKMEELRRKLLETIPEHWDTGTEVEIHCDSGVVQFSPCTETCAVTHKAELLTYLTEKGYDVLSLLKINVTDLKKILSEKELEPFVEKKQGSRTIKAVHQE